MKKKIILVILLPFLLLTQASYGMSSASYHLDWFTPLTTGGGGRSSSPACMVDITIGQSVVGSASNRYLKISKI